MENAPKCCWSSKREDFTVEVLHGRDYLACRKCLKVYVQRQPYGDWVYVFNKKPIVKVG